MSLSLRSAPMPYLIGIHLSLMEVSHLPSSPACLTSRFVGPCGSDKMAVTALQARVGGGSGACAASSLRGKQVPLHWARAPQESSHQTHGLSLSIGEGAGVREAGFDGGRGSHAPCLLAM